MAANSTFLAFDFGAESGRGILGIIEDQKLRLQEVHRFPNIPVRTLGGLHWDVLKLFDEVKQGLRTAFAQCGSQIDGIGVDTWGVDFGLLGEDGELLGNPFHYRDERTDGVMEEAFRTVSEKQIYEDTGIQFLPFNSLYQLIAMARGGASALASASTLLMMPDLFNYWLTGRKTGEFSNATTTQCYNPRTGDWAHELFQAFGLPIGIMPEIVQPGTQVGMLADTLVSELGAGSGSAVIAPATHDTGSAVAAVPASGSDHAYISSGTWSLMGVEVDQPVINDKTLKMGFTNEGGVGGTFRLLRNIMGLWLIQECRRTWAAAGEDISYADLTAMAQDAPGFVSVVDPDDTRFLSPGDMPTRLQDYCRSTGQPVPESKGQIVRCALDSLALRYRATVESLDDLLGRRINPIHIVGGGTQNEVLNQLTADATGRKVVAGPIEATAIGNVLVQAIGKGLVGSLTEARDIVRQSFPLRTYEPRESNRIESAYAKFADMTA